MSITISPLSTTDLPAAIDLWADCPGVGLNDRDTPANLTAYLERNPQCSQAAWRDDRLVGAVLAGHDGRRGYRHHLAVAPAQRRQGIGGELIEAARRRLAELGIDTCHCFVYTDNHAGRRFWTGQAWIEREELLIMTRRGGC